MPGDSKKKQKQKHEIKELRKPKQSRQQAKTDERTDKSKVDSNAHSSHGEPEPKLYLGLKSETNEVLKITEDENSKYKKKEIQSNWAKYEMPIKSYDETEEEEHLGADYEKLAQAPLSIGGHFQFKHEKSWDISTKPSLYDKYFEINMESLATALSTIPFYERNGIDKSLFSEIDLMNMDNRTIQYKQKYYNDKSFSTPELGILERQLLAKIGSNVEENNINNVDNFQEPLNIMPGKYHGDEKLEVTSECTNNNIAAACSNKPETLDPMSNKISIENDLTLNKIEDTVNLVDIDKGHLENPNRVQDEPDVLVTPASKNVVTESPEDLEKWLDDFLEG